MDDLCPIFNGRRHAYLMTLKTCLRSIAPEPQTSHTIASICSVLTDVLRMRLISSATTITTRSGPSRTAAICTEWSYGLARAKCAPSPDQKQSDDQTLRALAAGQSGTIVTNAVASGFSL